MVLLTMKIRKKKRQKIERESERFKQQQQRRQRRTERNSGERIAKMSPASNLVSAAFEFKRVNCDPVYLEDDVVFYNLILKEAAELESRQLIMIDNNNNIVRTKTPSSSGQLFSPLADPLRHSLLSWMLKVCESQMCQDDIFPLATMILDKFLLHYPAIQQLTNESGAGTEDDDGISMSLDNTPTKKTTIDRNRFDCEIAARIIGEFATPRTKAPQKQQRPNPFEDEDSSLSADAFHCFEDEFNYRRLYLFAACSLLLASKLRQTPRLCVQALIEFSLDELPVALGRGEILDGEILILSTLKWDLAALVTPNDFLTLLWSKCSNLLAATEMAARKKVWAKRADNSFWQPHLYRSRTGHDGQTTPITVHTSSNDNNNNNSNINTIITITPSTNGSGDSIINNNNDIINHTNHQANRCDESRVNRHTQALLELCLMDSQLSQYAPSVLAMASLAVAIYGMNLNEDFSWRLDDIVEKIHESTHKVNQPELMIDVAYKIEKYVQKLLNSAHDD